MIGKVILWSNSAVIIRINDYVCLRSSSFLRKIYPQPVYGTAFQNNLRTLKRYVFHRKGNNSFNNDEVSNKPEQKCDIQERTLNKPEHKSDIQERTSYKPEQKNDIQERKLNKQEHKSDIQE